MLDWRGSGVSSGSCTDTHGEEHRDERRLLGSGQAQRRIQRARREGVGDEREQDAPAAGGRKPRPRGDGGSCRWVDAEPRQGQDEHDHGDEQDGGHGSSLSHLGAVSDDAQIHAGQQGEQPKRQRRLGQAAQGRARRRGAHQHVGGPRSAATRAVVVATSSPCSTSRWAPSTLASRRRAAICSCSSSVGSWSATHRTSSSAPRRWAERHARRTMRWDSGRGVTSASSRSPIAWGAAVSTSRSSRPR